jgi:hypothetical protein
LERNLSTTTMSASAKTESTPKEPARFGLESQVKRNPHVSVDSFIRPL